MCEQLRVCSYGGGCQSTALLVLAAQRVIDFPHFVFALTGEDSEEPGTLAYVHQHALPFASAHGITLEIVRRERRTGEQMTLYQHIMSDRFKGVQIPVRLSNGSPARRHCTVDYKIDVLRRWERTHGASKEHPAIVALGISWDEVHRMRTNTDEDRVIVYPLIERRATRLDCEAIIRGAGLPVPPRSKCWLCPYTTQAEWQRMRHERPALFAQAVAMEAFMDAKMMAEGEGHISLHSKGPLLAITSEHRQLSLTACTTMQGAEQPDTCESGYCMT